RARPALQRDAPFPAHADPVRRWHRGAGAGAAPPAPGRPQQVRPLRPGVARPGGHGRGTLAEAARAEIPGERGEGSGEGGEVGDPHLSLFPFPLSPHTSPLSCVASVSTHPFSICPPTACGPATTPTSISFVPGTCCSRTDTGLACSCRSSGSRRDTWA